MKLSFEYKVQIYKLWQTGEASKSLSKQFNIAESRIQYMVRLIDRYEIDFVQSGKNTYYLPEYKSALKDKTLSLYHKWIQAVYFRSQKIAFKTIFESSGFSHDTIWRLVKKYEQEGLSLLIQVAWGDRHRFSLTYEEEKSFLQEQFTSSASGQFITIAELHEAYPDLVGKQTIREGFYVLVKRHSRFKESRDSLRWVIKLTQ